MIHVELLPSTLVSNTDHDAVNILIVANGAVIAVEVTEEVAYPCTAVIRQAMTSVG